MPGRQRDRLRMEFEWHRERAWRLRYPRHPKRRHHTGAQLPAATRHGVGGSIRSDSPQTEPLILLAVHIEKPEPTSSGFSFYAAAEVNDAVRPRPGRAEVASLLAAARSAAARRAASARSTPAHWPGQHLSPPAHA